MPSQNSEPGQDLDANESVNSEINPFVDSKYFLILSFVSLTFIAPDHKKSCYGNVHYVMYVTTQYLVHFTITSREVNKF